ncbi:MAG: hypothetical protein M1815_000638 [Lichina confinis]|nr:MAG: hypothetical protein M1815_000638 [Lichina confinis]
MKASVAVPITALLVTRALRRNSLTPAGIVAAAATALVHATHPYAVFFACLVVFFLAGTAATRIRHDFKRRLTLSASGDSGGEGPRTHIQVLANSAAASVLIILHVRQVRRHDAQSCWNPRADILVPGIIANYAAVAADTFSSELGILSKGRPRLITSLTLREVPPGTNGGVTLFGFAAGLLGSFMIAATSVLLLPFCPGSTSTEEKLLWTLVITVWGGLGSLLDSFLGGWLQASVVDVRSGKVVEGSGGAKVLVTTSRSPSFRKKAGEKTDESRQVTGGSGSGTSSALDAGDGAGHELQLSEKAAANKIRDGASRRRESGLGVLDNNAVNFLMAVIMSVGAVLTSSWYWDVPLSSIW